MPIFLSQYNLDISRIKSYGTKKIQLLFDATDFNKETINQKVLEFGDGSLKVLSYNKIGKALFDLGFKTPHGKPLDQKQIYRLCNS